MGFGLGVVHVYPPHELIEWSVVLKPLNAMLHPAHGLYDVLLTHVTMPLRAETTASDTIVIINYNYMRDRPELYSGKRLFFKDP